MCGPSFFHIITFPPYCSLGGGSTRPVTVTILVSTEIPKSCTYGSALKLARATYNNNNNNSNFAKASSY